MIELQRYFERLIFGRNYCVIRIRPDFPNQAVGSDIDILTEDLPELLPPLALLGDYTRSNVNGHTHCDFMDNNDLLIRFDFVTDIPGIKNHSIILSRSSIQKINGVSVRVPEEYDDAVLRYLAYREDNKKTHHLAAIKLLNQKLYLRRLNELCAQIA